MHRCLGGGAGLIPRGHLAVNCNPADEPASANGIINDGCYCACCLVVVKCRRKSVSVGILMRLKNIYRGQISEGHRHGTFSFAHLILPPCKGEDTGKMELIFLVCPNDSWPPKMEIKPSRRSF